MNSHRNSLKRDFIHAWFAENSHFFLTGVFPRGYCGRWILML